KEAGELIERPTIDGAVVFLGRSPTTCACRALPDSFKGFDFDCCYTLRVGVVHYLARYLVVDILHPAAFLVLGPRERLLFFEVLQLLATSIELPPLVSHLSSIAVEPSGLACNKGDRWDFDACVHSHDDFPRGLLDS